MLFLKPLRNHPLLTTSTLSFLILFKLYKKYKDKEQAINSRGSRLVVITGCDSGLGLSMAVWSRRMGYFVLAGVVDPEGPGALILNNEGVKCIHLDFTRDREVSLEKFRLEVDRTLEENRFELWAVICNSGFLVCGEFMWQTSSLLKKQMEVNFWGPVDTARALQPLVFKHQSRVIIISSDCSKIQYPGLALYSGSKAALEAWSRSLRLEVSKYGVLVTAYRPGSFPFVSKIFSGHDQHYEQMEREMKPLDKEFYGQYFQSWKEVKIGHSKKLPPIHILDSPRHLKDLEHLLESDISKTPIYDYESLEQRIPIWIEKYLPRSWSDKVLRLMMDAGSPPWQGERYDDLITKHWNKRVTNTEPYPSSD